MKRPWWILMMCLAAGCDSKKKEEMTQTPNTSTTPMLQTNANSNDAAQNPAPHSYETSAPVYTPPSARTQAPVSYHYPTPPPAPVYSPTATSGTNPQPPPPPTPPPQ